MKKLIRSLHAHSNVLSMMYAGYVVLVLSASVTLLKHHTETKTSPVAGIVKQ